MKITFILLLILFSGCDSTPKHNGIICLRGVVVLETGKPVSGAPVVLYEDISHQFNLYPKSDRKIAEIKTNENGEFTLSSEDSTPLDRLKLVAESKKRIIETAPYTYKVIFDNGTVRNPSKDAINKIVVPKTFIPAK